MADVSEGPDDLCKVALADLEMGVGDVGVAVVAY